MVCACATSRHPAWRAETTPHESTLTQHVDKPNQPSSGEKGAAIKPPPEKGRWSPRSTTPSRTPRFTSETRSSRSLRCPTAQPTAQRTARPAVTPATTSATAAGRQSTARAPGRSSGAPVRQSQPEAVPRAEDEGCNLAGCADDLVADDVGVGGGGVGPEEAAIHVLRDDE